MTSAAAQRARSRRLVVMVQNHAVSLFRPNSVPAMMRARAISFIFIYGLRRVRSESSLCPLERAVMGLGVGWAGLGLCSGCIRLLSLIDAFV